MSNDNIVKIDIDPVAQPTKGAVATFAARHAQDWPPGIIEEVLTAFGLQEKPGSFLIRLPTHGTLYLKAVGFKETQHQELDFQYPQDASALCGGFMAGCRHAVSVKTANIAKKPPAEQNMAILGWAKKVTRYYWEWTYGKRTGGGIRIDLVERTARELYEIKLESLAPGLEADKRQKLARDPTKRLDEVTRLDGIRRARDAGATPEQLRNVDWDAYVESKRDEVRRAMNVEVEKTLKVKRGLRERKVAAEANFAAEFADFMPKK